MIQSKVFVAQFRYGRYKACKGHENNVILNNCGRAQPELVEAINGKLGSIFRFADVPLWCISIECQADWPQSSKLRIQALCLQHNKSPSYSGGQQPVMLRSTLFASRRGVPLPGSHGPRALQSAVVRPRRHGQVPKFPMRPTFRHHS